MANAISEVIDGAAAADGGSLLLIVARRDGQNETLFLNRSIASRGTSEHDIVTSDKRELSPAEYIDVALELEHLWNLRPGTAHLFDLVPEFITSLRKQGMNASA